MNYCYDIRLNFMEENYLFYEWEVDDNVEEFKKLPLFQVNSKTLSDFINYDIMVTDEFLDLIRTKSGVMIALFADKNGAIALEFDDSGKSILRSFLTIDDELNVLDRIYGMSVSVIDYQILNKKKYKDNLRMEEKIKFIINTELNSLIRENDECKLKYLFWEWFNQGDKSIDSMILKMKNRLNEKVGEDELKIFNLIKLSYSNV